MQETGKTKVCLYCKENLPYVCYSLDKDSKEGLWKYCKTCARKCDKFKKPRSKQLKLKKLKTGSNKTIRENKKLAKIGKNGNTKKCAKCGEFLPFNDFFKCKNDYIGLSNQCKGCYKKHVNIVKENGLTKVKENYIKNTYNLSIEEYLQMLEEQDNKCKICGKSEISNNNGKIKALAIDHHHDSGRVRGLLCQKCNTALGMFLDDIKLLETAIEYLKNN